LVEQVLKERDLALKVLK
jgi:hypothetical protein